MEILKLNVTPLINQRVCIPASSGINCERGFYLAGLEDLATRTLRYVYSLGEARLLLELHFTAVVIVLQNLDVY